MPDKNKKSFKEIHGKTKVGMFLKKNAPKLLDIVLDTAGSLIPGAAGVADIIGGLINANVTGELSESQLVEGANYVELELKKMEVEIVEMQELTKRLQSDNEHNITRLVRPVSYAFAWVILAFIMFFDGNAGTFKVNVLYLPIINDMINVMTVFYFGSRGIEKIAKEVNKYRNKGFGYRLGN